MMTRSQRILDNERKAISRIIGKRFGRLIGVKFLGRMKLGTQGATCLFYSCKCDCGVLIKVPGYSLTSKNTTSCGCFGRERRALSTRTHGWCAGKDERKGRARPEYAAWLQMKDRIKRAGINPKYKSYIGLTICKRWINSFKNFIADMGAKPTLAHSLDRKNVQLGYYPSNCRWATRSDQDNNRTNTVWVKYKGHKKSLQIWANESGIDRATVVNRIKKNWPLKLVFTKGLTRSDSRKFSRKYAKNK